MGVLRLRIALITTMVVVIALAAGDIFDRFIWKLTIAPVGVGCAALLTGSRWWLVRLVSASLAIIVATTAVVLLSEGEIGDVFTAFTSGPQRLLSTDWPSPDGPDLVGTVAFVLALSTALGADLARRRHLHLGPLVPVAVAHGLVIALSAPIGTRLHWLVALGVVAIGFATIRPGVSLRDRWTLLLGERRLVPLAAIAIGLAAAVAVPVAMAGRADPRYNDPPAASATLLDPIEATLALQDIDPPIDLHGVEIDDRALLAPTRWRTAALVEYDGRRWAPTLTLRPIGRRLGVADGDVVDGAISFLDDDLRLVPLPGAPIVVEARVETDPDRTIVLLSDRSVPGERVQFVAEVEPLPGQVSPGEVATREIDENVSRLSELAESMIADAAGDNASAPTDVLDRLRLLERSMREDFLLDPNASGGGLQRALIVRFIRDTRRGNSEQFATAFVLLARSLGVDARVATGFRIDPDRFTGGFADDDAGDGDQLSFTLTSADAAIWPEVSVGGDWVAFDPVPQDEISDAVPEPPEPQVQTPAAPQPPIAAPPEADDDPVVTETEDATDRADALPTLVLWGLRVAAGAGALMASMVVVVGIILALKHRRRRRVLAGPADARIRGAWSVATNRLVDAGMRIGPAATNGEIADDGVMYADAAARELRRLATLASAATFGSPARPDLLAEDARSCLGQVETTMAQSRTRWQRLRWRLSLRSLRGATRSPV